MPPIRYYYKVERIIETSFEQQESKVRNDLNTNHQYRSIVTRNGIHIKFVQSGMKSLRIFVSIIKSIFFD